ncbi:MAG TPA: hypothetical protein VHX88_09775 [Solirubrobacteraceae bacterium]|nr:hypothetical protein [Solirubrobacteraceae bacterium]
MGGLLLALVALYIVHHLAVHQGLAISRAHEALHPALRVILASLGLFAVCGYGVVRLALPASLRRHEPLWILPVGACAASVLMTLLGYAHLPYHVNLWLTIAAGAALSLYAAFRCGPLPRAPGGWGGVLAAAYGAALLGFIVLIPLLRADFATVTGTGSDAHLAAGSAQFLQHYTPGSFHVASPVDTIPLQWRSKVPIYYVFAAVSSLAGLQTFQVLSTLEAVMLALMVVGFFLLCRDVMGMGVLAAIAASAIVGLDRMVVHTITHPYYNQTWGMFTIPFGLVLAWSATSRTRSGGWPGFVLLVLVLGVCAFAYPLAAPIPAGALVVFWWFERRGQRRRGEPVADLHPRVLWGRIYHGPKSLLPIVPIALLLIIPIRGVWEKISSGWNVVFDPLISLKGWGGDLSGYFPEGQYFGLPTSHWLAILAAPMVIAVVLALRGRPRPLGWGLLAIFAVGLLGALWFRIRPHGYYFEYKLLCFTAPVLIVVVVAGLERLKLVGALLGIGWLALAFGAARAEIKPLGPELSPSMIDLQHLNRAVPDGASIRLDMDPPLQLWVAYMLADHPVCSQTPLLNTAYPHVPESRKADYILADYQLVHPFDALGPPVRLIGPEFRLYRENPDTPGIDRCSTKRVQTVTSLSGS